MTTRRTGLREQKKHATREALSAAALQLALERGLDSLRVNDIAEAAGVAPRTYNNYFSSREQAIIAAITADRESRVAAAVIARPVDVSLSAAVVDAVVGQYVEPDKHARDVLLLITTNPTLRASYIDAAAMIESPLADVLVERCALIDPLTARVLAASVGAAVRVALDAWVQPSSSSGIVVPSGSLPDLLRTALAPLLPAMDAAERRHRD
ncbi:TetR family transcriptional regulator [Antricoccus suffuscus]|uniref:TetR family transcriptional regulator n=1 Tax=Antricoccus suffuscus TaxID=1629062 RepID=A0A2T1A115_9ACTN|nr:TetR/AcrR family transcriptional regulator [Antricoccus suffuscus]PRZ42300.1 TetR family transcriptional regulator [Antricoccus suffuscus]